MALPAAGLGVVAVIDEATCIGCTLCIEACPADAIVGAAKLMHTVIAAECIGCKLCVPPCPVDCITLVETGVAATPAERRRRAAHFKTRYSARLARKRAEPAAPVRAENPQGRKQAAIERAMQRARQRLLARRLKS